MKLKILLLLLLISLPVFLTSCNKSKSYSVTFLDWNDNLLAVEYYDYNTDLSQIDNAPMTERYGYNFLLWDKLPERMPSENITVVAKYISWWDVFRNYMIKNGTKSVDENGIWYSVVINKQNNIYEISYNDANYENKGFNLKMTYTYSLGSSNQILILKYSEVFNKKTDYFYTLDDTYGNPLGYGMGPNTFVSTINPKVDFLFTTLTPLQIQQAQSQLIMLLEFYKNYFAENINIPLI